MDPGPGPALAVAALAPAVTPAPAPALCRNLHRVPHQVLHQGDKAPAPAVVPAQALRRALHPGTRTLPQVDLALTLTITVPKKSSKLSWTS